jgi:hypothetical protein
LVDKCVKTGKEKYSKQSNKHSRRIIVVIITAEFNEYKQLVERTQSDRMDLIGVMDSSYIYV